MKLLIENLKTYTIFYLNILLNLFFTIIRKKLKLLIIIKYHKLYTIYGI